jgi:heat shock protein HtpX
MEKRMMFEEVRRNNLYSNLLIIVFIVFIGLLGAIIGLIYDSVIFGLVVSLVIGFVYILIMFSSGDSMVLGLTGARPVTKKEYPHLYHTVEGLSIAAGIPTPKAYVIDDPALNAFATGMKPENASIAVTKGLMEKLNRQELEGVVAHEIAHIKNNDIKYMLLITVLIGMTMLLSNVILRSFLWGGGRRSSKGGQAQIILIIIGLLLAVLSPIIVQLIRFAISRKKEYAADANAAVMTRYPPGLASALKKIKGSSQVKTASKATAHLFISSPFKASDLFSTHPPIDERIKRLESM